VRGILESVRGLTQEEEDVLREVWRNQTKDGACLNCSPAPDFEVGSALLGESIVDGLVRRGLLRISVCGVHPEQSHADVTPDGVLVLRLVETSRGTE
jgi:hypothetical protein